MEFLVEHPYTLVVRPPLTPPWRRGIDNLNNLRPPQALRGGGTLEFGLFHRNFLPAIQINALLGGLSIQAATIECVPTFGMGIGN